MARPKIVDEATVATVTINGKEYIPLPDPETVAELTAAEVRELEAIATFLKRVTDEAQHAQRIVQVAAAHRTAFLRDLLASKHLSGAEDLYNINAEEGLVQKTHLAVPPDPQLAE